MLHPPQKSRGDIRRHPCDSLTGGGISWADIILPTIELGCHEHPTLCVMGDALQGKLHIVMFHAVFAEHP